MKLNYSTGEIDSLKVQAQLIDLLKCLIFKAVVCREWVELEVKGRIRARNGVLSELKVTVNNNIQEAEIEERPNQFFQGIKEND